jgi:hypothetical protein
MFKWLVLKAGMAVMRPTSSLFAVTYNREMFREILEITHDPVQTTKEMFKIGYYSARESAIRQQAVFKLFPASPIKLIEYIPLLYQIVLGIPMENYELEWDRSNPNYPKALYKVPLNPMEFGLGTDPECDNLPFTEFWDGQSGYSAIVVGMLTQVTSYILEMRNQPQAILITNSKSKIRGEGFFGISCEVIPREQLPKYEWDTPIPPINTTENSDRSDQFRPDTSGASPVSDKGTEGYSNQNATSESDGAPMPDVSASNQILSKLLDKIPVDQLEEIFGSPTGGLEVLIRKAVNAGFHMTTEEFLDHFTNFEDDFIRIMGFLIPHILNEGGQIPQKIIEDQRVAKYYGHLFLNLQKNAQKVLSLQLIDDFRTILLNVLEKLAPDIFIKNLREIPSDRLVSLYFEGMRKGWQDLGVPFAELKASLAEEFKAQKLSDSPQPEKAEGIELNAGSSKTQEEIILEIMEEMFGVIFLLTSIPAQLTLLLTLNAVTGVSDLISKLFNVLKESGQKVVDLIEKMPKK